MPERINFVEIFELSEKIIHRKDTFIWLKLQNVTMLFLSMFKVV